jgi:hypothetical protein
MSQIKIRYLMVNPLFTHVSWYPPVNYITVRCGVYPPWMYRSFSSGFLWAFHSFFYVYPFAESPCRPSAQRTMSPGAIAVWLLEPWAAITNKHGQISITMGRTYWELVIFEDSLMIWWRGTKWLNITLQPLHPKIGDFFCENTWMT